MTTTHLNCSVMKTTKSILTLAVAALVCASVHATVNIGSKPSVSRTMSNGCPQDGGSAYLQINNVRMRIMSEGDMWWDPGAGLPRYYVPAGGSTCSMFAGSLWIGGVMQEAS